MVTWLTRVSLVVGRPWCAGSCSRRGRDNVSVWRFLLCLTGTATCVLGHKTVGVAGTATIDEFLTLLTDTVVVVPCLGSPTRTGLTG